MIVNKKKQKKKKKIGLVLILVILNDFVFLKIFYFNESINDQ